MQPLQTEGLTIKKQDTIIILVLFLASFECDLWLPRLIIMKFYSYPIIFGLMHRPSLILINGCRLKFIAERAELGGGGGIAARRPQPEVVPPVRLRRRARLAAVAAGHPDALILSPKAHTPDSSAHRQGFTASKGMLPTIIKPLVIKLRLLTKTHSYPLIKGCCS